MSGMLTEYYKLAVQPFGVTPDPRFLYLSATHKEAMASLLLGIRFGRGFTALIAPPGMGKTTLLLNLLHSIKDDAKTAFLFQTLCEPREFLAALLADLGIEGEDESITRMHAKLNAYLLRESQNGRQVVVIIDEAQNLNEQVLEVLRMLSNFETEDKKLLHVVLAGQPQLAKKLSSSELTQLRQRISIVARLAPLNARETRDYIEHRLKLAGHASDKPIFTNDAYAMIAEQSQGIPREINNICFNAMTLACALKRPIVDGSMVQETIRDLDLRTIVIPPRTRNEQGGRILDFSRETHPTVKWQRAAFAAILVLVSLLTPTSRIVGFAWKQFVIQHSTNTSHSEPNHSFEIAATSGVAAPERNTKGLPRASIATTQTPRTRTRSEKSRMVEGSRATAESGWPKENSSTPATGIVDPLESDHNGLNDKVEFNSLLNKMGLSQQMPTISVPVNQQPAREIQSGPEQHTAPGDFAEKGVNP